MAFKDLVPQKCQHSSSHVCSSSARPGERECHDATNRVAILGKAACKVQYRKAECLQMVNKKQKISGGAWTFCLPAVHLNTTGISKANSAKSEDSTHRFLKGVMIHCLKVAPSAAMLSLPDPWV
jgi:hypothetical protein